MFFTNLQALRAACAVSVVLLHVGVNATKYGYQSNVIGSFFEKWGGIGVDLFFVISGFLMANIVLRSRLSALSFLLRRIIRIVPIYWIFTSVYVLLLIAAPSLFGTAVYSWASAVSSFLFVSQLFLSHVPVLSVGWSLEFEMLFYVLLSIIYYIVKPPYTLYASIVVLLFIGRMNPIVIEFAFGLAVAMLYDRGLLRSYFMQLIFGLMLIYALIFISVDLCLPFSRVIAWGIPALAGVLSLIAMPQMRTNFFVRIGNASYSIYLIQVFSVPVFYKMCVGLHVDLIPNDIMALTCCLFTVVLGSLFFYLVERPVTRLLRILVLRIK